MESPATEIQAGRGHRGSTGCLTPTRQNRKKNHLRRSTGLSKRKKQNKSLKTTGCPHQGNCWIRQHLIIEQRNNSEGLCEKKGNKFQFKTNEAIKTSYYIIGRKEIYVRIFKLFFIEIYCDIYSGIVISRI